MQDAGKIELSIIIVTYNNEEEIAECLQSIFKHESNIKTEIIIVDNNSSDNTLKVIDSINKLFNKNINVIKNNRNFGFTRACNQGIKLSNGENILLLNPDTEIIDNSLNYLYEKLIKSGYGAVVPQLLNKDGSVQYSCRFLPDYKDLFLEIFLISILFPKSKTLAKWKMKYFSHNEECDVEQPMAAVLMIKRELLKNIDFFDERYFMFFNDVDLCKKIKDSGNKIRFFPESKFIHKKGASVFKQRAKMIRYWNADCLQYFGKYNYKPIYYFVLKILLSLTGFFRILFKL